MKPLHLALPLVVAAAAIAGCGGGGSSNGNGTLRLAITDAPACGYDEVNITVEKVRVHRSDRADDGDAGWSEIVLPTPQRLDLLSLTNGVLVELGETELPAGTYTQMRLVLARNGNAAPFANSVLPTGGNETALTTPSAQQSGLKLNVNLTVAPDAVADFVIDFDACKSIVKRGASGQYNLKPVVAVMPRIGDAGQRVVGYVDPALARATTSVSVQAAGVPVKATVPGADGRFVLYPVPSGQYDLVVTAAGRVTAVMTGVPVTTTAVTTVSSASTAITPPATVLAPRVVDGTVAPASATVRALQLLSGGPTIEVAWGSVDAASGAFGFTLPIEPPVRTAYAGGAPYLPFGADSLALGLYRIEAESAGVKKSVDIDTNEAVAPLAISFP
jgi:hypothetical protein